MNPKRAEVVAQAMRWLGTPYHHHARVLGAGVDCAQLPAAVFHDAGIIPEIHPEYASQWMKHRDEEAYLSWITDYAHEIPRETLGPGDLVVWKFGRTFSHSAIVVDVPTIIHAMARDRAVVLGDMERDEYLTSRDSKFFSVFD